MSNWEQRGILYNNVMIALDELIRTTPKGDYLPEAGYLMASQDLILAANKMFWHKAKRAGAHFDPKRDSATDTD